MTAPDRLEVLAVLDNRADYPSPDPDTGADRGSCCEHAYSDGWNDCIESLAEFRGAIRELIETARELGNARADYVKRASIQAARRLDNAEIRHAAALAALSGGEDGR